MYIIKAQKKIVSLPASVSNIELRAQCGARPLINPRKLPASRPRPACSPGISS